LPVVGLINLWLILGGRLSHCQASGEGKICSAAQLVATTKQGNVIPLAAQVSRMEGAQIVTPARVQLEQLWCTGDHMNHTDSYLVMIF
jgi:hypothetical protein